MKNIKILSIFLVIVIAFASCKKDDHTGFSTLVPVSGVTLTITPDFTSPVTMVEADSTFNYTITLNKAQLVDLKLYIKVDATTATAGDDFDYLSSIVIPAGSTTAKGWIKIFSDTQFEEGESFSIQVGDATFSNADFTPVTYVFNVNNLTGDDLLLDLSWAPVAYDQFGESIDPTDIADMMLFVRLNGVDIDTIDGSGFESYVLLGTAADGVYTFAAQYYDAMSFDTPVDMPFALSTFQIGVSTSTVDFEYTGLGTTKDANQCDFEYLFATIEKTGVSYNVVSTPDRYISTFDLNNFVGNYTGLEYELYGGGMYGGYPALITSLNATSDTVLVDSLGRQVMMNFWGETPLTHIPTKIVMNDDGTLDIPRQFCMTTDWASDYDISGSGTWNSCDMSMDIQFDLIYSDDSGALSDYADDGVLHAEIDKSKKSYHTTIPLKTTSFKHHR